VSITSPIMHNFRILFLRSYHPPDSFLSIRLFRLRRYGVKGVLDALPEDIRARFERIVNLIQTDGLERVREPYVKHLEGRLWEMRMKGKHGIARAAYVTASGHRSWCMCSPRRPRKRRGVKSKRP
jgi:hypothetical protein